MTDQALKEILNSLIRMIDDHQILTEVNDDLIAKNEYLSEVVNEIRHQTIQEFAERLKKHFASPNMHKMIDKIAEEMEK